MTLFRNLLIVMAIVMLTFTLLTILHHGLNFIAPFLAPILAVTWQGQFNVDFVLYLVLASIWIAWRSGFSGSGIGFAMIAPLLGMSLLAPYLIFLIARGADTPQKLLLGVHASR